MKIQRKRDRIQCINYGTVVYELDEFGNPDTSDPLIVVNAETNSSVKDDEGYVFVVYLNDGVISTLNDDTIVEIADVTLVVNQ